MIYESWVSPKIIYCMTDLADIFTELGISHYLQVFIEQGFDSWDTILDITESDFDVLGVKLGHRRKIQRRIANTRGVSSDIALDPRNTPPMERVIEEVPRLCSEAKEAISARSVKRKYRRHPKPDENAPERPPSAYVIFSNKTREQLKGRNLTFTEIAKLVGEKWQNLSSCEKELYEKQAFTAKERYNNELAEYKKTNCYREYARYLVEFKARQTGLRSGDVDCYKRSKMDNSTSMSSVSSASPILSSSEQVVTTARPESATSTVPTNLPSRISSWSPIRESKTSENYQDTSNGGITTATSNGAPSNSPTTKSQPLPLVYHESSLSDLLSPASYRWREVQSDEAASVANAYPRTSSIDGTWSTTPEPLASSRTASLHLNLTTQVPRPTTVESGHRLNMSPKSSNPKTSSSLTSLNRRAYMEPSFDRALPILSHHSQKSVEQLERQLPPLARLPYSPAANLQSPSNQQHYTVDGYHRTIDSYQKKPLSTRCLMDNSHQKIRDYMAQNITPENPLDPVSALLRAGELVAQSGSGR